MVRYIIKRALMSVFIIFVIATLTFFLAKAIPGGPFSREKPIPEEIRARLDAEWNLDKPLFTQYLLYMQNVVKMDFGISFFYGGETINEEIQRTFPVSANLGIWAFLLAVLLGIPFGMWSALRVDGAADNTLRVMTTLFIAIPSFVIAGIAAYFFGVALRWLPVAFEGGAEMMFPIWMYYLMPVTALAAYPLATITKYMRASMLDVLDSDYIRTAKAKGGSAFTVTFVHAMKNALLPILTISGPMFAGIVCGSFVIEDIFNIPGLGRSFTRSILNRDYSKLMALTLFYAVILIVVLFVVDVLYSFVDPRIKINDGGGKKSQGGE